jgi:hypothetical protein
VVDEYRRLVYRSDPVREPTVPPPRPHLSQERISRTEPEVFDALVVRWDASQGAHSLQSGAPARQILCEAFSGTVRHATIAAGSVNATGVTPGTKILLVLVAVLIGVAAAFTVGLLAHDGNVRKSIVRGLYVFAAVTAGCIAGEGELGLF